MNNFYELEEDPKPLEFNLNLDKYNLVEEVVELLIIVIFIYLIRKYL
jgi:hypothetical protein